MGGKVRGVLKPCEGTLRQEHLTCHGTCRSRRPLKNCHIPTLHLAVHGMRAASTVLSESTRCSAAASRMFGLLCTSVSTASPCKYSQSRYVAFDARRKRGKDRNKRHMCSDYGKPHKLSLIAAKTAVEGRRSQLHEELVDFAWRCSPTPASIRLAELSTRAIELAWERATEHPPIVAAPFGSQPCATALPGGDLDVSVYLSAVCSSASSSVPSSQSHCFWCRTQTTLAKTLPFMLCSMRCLF